MRPSRLLLLCSARITGLDAAGWSLEGEFCGERLDAARHSLNVDVKAVTFHRFQVVSTEST